MEHSNDQTRDDLLFWLIFEVQKGWIFVLVRGWGTVSIKTSILNGNGLNLQAYKSL